MNGARPDLVRAAIGHALAGIEPGAERSGAPLGGRPILIGFSGGLDSTVLLDACVSLLGPERLVAAHVHHGLQPDADRWVEHCQREARSRGVRFECLRLGPPQSGGIGLEAWARDARYQALWALAASLDAAVLMTAHQADDRAETVLMRLARGTGLDGLASALPGCSSGPAGRWLVRPLLDLTRAQLSEYASAHGLRWVDDPMNRDLAYRRVRAREQLLPALEQVAPGALRQLARTQELLAEAATELEALAEHDLASARIDVRSGQAQALDRRVLAVLSPFRQSQLVRRWWRALADAPTAFMPTQAQMAEWRSQMIDSLASQAIIHWSPWVFVRYRDRIEAWHVRSMVAASLLPAGPPRPTACEIRWQGEAEVDLPGWAARLRFQSPAGDTVAALRASTRVIQVVPASGDWRARLSAQGLSRPLRKLWQERGVPPALRPWLPLIEVDGVAVEAAGIGSLHPAERADALPAARFALLFEPVLPEDPRGRFCEPHRI